MISVFEGMVSGCIRRFHAVSSHGYRFRSSRQLASTQAWAFRRHLAHRMLGTGFCGGFTAVQYCSSHDPDDVRTSKFCPQYGVLRLVWIDMLARRMKGGMPLQAVRVGSLQPQSAIMFSLKKVRFVSKCRPAMTTPWGSAGQIQRAMTIYGKCQMTLRASEHGWERAGLGRT